MADADLKRVLLLAAILALAIGVSLGLLGGGGSILTVPILVYALHVAPKAAIAASLFVVGVTSLAGMIAYARAGTLRARAGLVFGGAGMTGAYAGGRLAHLVRGELLLVAFGGVMLLTALAMIRPRARPRATRPALPGKLVAVGAFVGVASGLIGAGGGFLIVPALLWFGGLNMREAVGTSLMVIAMQCLAGFAGQLAAVRIDWPLTLVVAAAAVAGSLVGVRLARRVAQATLRKGFGWFVLAMGLFVLAKELPALPVALVGAAAVGLAAWLSRTPDGRATPWLSADARLR